MRSSRWLATGVIALAGCGSGATDPCDGNNDIACVTLTVRGDVGALDTVELRVGELARVMRYAVPGGSLPVVLALPLDAGGSAAVVGLGLRAGLLVGVGRTEVIAPDAKRGAATLDLAAVSGPTCDDGILDGTESDVDCGGAKCAACATGKACLGSDDCASRSCKAGTCADPACDDGARNGDETDVDCGGGTCGKCKDGGGCARASDCASMRCGDMRCLAASCGDGSLDGKETDLDCGGPVCNACDDGKKCAGATDCTSALCVKGRCAQASCADGLLDGAETDLDCGGGACSPCATGQICKLDSDCAEGRCASGRCAGPSCADGLKDGAESDVDCGGPCAPCGEMRGCAKATDCASGVCNGGKCAKAACNDGVPNGGESDVDCGGPCAPCGDGRACGGPADCVGGVCAIGDGGTGRCAIATCRDGAKNAGESDVDCGGPCVPCADGKACGRGADCANRACLANRCTAPACNDNAWNGDETDVDCGGGCGMCADGKRCLIALDCVSGVCAGGQCQVPACGDAAKNGGESDVDCGGPCAPCGAGRSCRVDADCANRICRMGTCLAADCNDHVRDGNETDVDCGGDACGPCADGKVCRVSGDCASGACSGGLCIGCSDGIRNGGETDVDCGGWCARCADGRACGAGTDCASGSCALALCRSCQDGIENGGETDIDCGGPCAPCVAGKGCVLDADCAAGTCVLGACRTCSDGARNGDETDVDCGGSCAPCADGRRCARPTDCASQQCTAAVCTSCSNALLDGTESDVDCGGSCAACAVGKVCRAAADCASGDCWKARCALPVTITSITPDHGDENQDKQVVLRGTQFDMAATVTVGGVAPQQATRVSATQIDLTVAAPRRPGPVRIVVENPDGQRATVIYHARALQFALQPLNYTSYTPGWTPSTLAAGDFDEDGHLDLAGGGYGLIYFRGHGDGRFDQPVYKAGFSSATASLIARDLDGDKHLDLAAINTYDGTIGLLYGVGDGTFVSAVTLDAKVPYQQSLRHLAIADLDGNGQLDLVVTTSDNYGNSGYAVLLGKGARSFGLPAITSLGGVVVADLALADLTGDGQVDIVVPDWKAGSVSVLPSLGGGAFGAAQKYAVDKYPGYMAVADLNADGAPDVLVQAGSPKYLARLLGKPGGGLGAASVAWKPADSGNEIFVADLDGDGARDLVIPHYGADLTVLRGAGDGTFGAGGQGITDWSTGDRSYTVSIADFDGDGKLDAVVATDNTFYDHLVFLRGLGNGTFDSPRLLDTLRASDMTAFDVNHDGLDDVAIVGTDVRVYASVAGAWSKRVLDLPTAAGRVSVGDLDGNGEADLVLGNGGVLLGRGGAFDPIFGDVHGTLGAIADFDGDGRLDWLFAAAQRFGLQRGLGDGTLTGGVQLPFQNHQYYTPGAMYGVDINEDGHPDLVYDDPFGYVVNYAQGKGDGTFVAPVAVVPYFNDAIGAAVADFDRDGHLDVISQTDFKTLALARGRGDGTFAAATSFTVPIYIESNLAMGDLDGDGILDLAGGSSLDETVLVLIGNGDGTFTGHTFPSGSLTRICIADLNGDGMPELIAGNGYPMVLVNQSK